MMIPSAIARPWIKAGLSVLLVDSPQRVAELRRKEDEAALAAQPSSAAGERRKAPAAFRAPAQDRQAAVRAPASQAFAKAAPSSEPSAETAFRAASQERPVRPPSRAAAAAPSPDGGILATPGALPVEEWPASWLALKNRRPLPPRPLVLWTYTGLGEDLTGKPDEVRRRVIVRMLMELHHPGGTHVFWPCGLAGEHPEDGPALFWSGVKLLNPRVLLLFGSDTRDTLSMPKSLLPFCQDRVHGRLVIQLPRPQALAQDEASFKRALAFLSRLLRFCARRQV